MNCYHPHQIALLGVFLMALSSVNSLCEEVPPLKLIYDVVSHYRTVHACDRTLWTDSSVTEDGTRRVTYNGEIEPSESGLDLCNCMHAFISQVDWLSGSKQSCCIKDDVASMTVEGVPDPDFENRIAFPTVKTALKQFRNAMDQFPYIQWERHRCHTQTQRIHNKWNLNVKCDLRKDSPKKDTMCRGMLWYLNQDGWLGHLNTTCVSDDRTLTMNIQSASDAKEALTLS